MTQSKLVFGIAVLVCAGCAAESGVPVDRDIASIEPVGALNSLLLETTADPNRLAAATLGPGDAITLRSATYDGASVASATFGDGPQGLATGILLTSGEAMLALPPSDSPSTSRNNNRAGNALCDGLVRPYRSYDATQFRLSFDLAAGFSGVEFLSVFGSEEYPEYVGTQFNDVFAVFVNGTLVRSWSINEFTGTNGVVGPATETEYDGSTVILQTRVPLTGGSANNVLEVVVCDTGDRVYDSGVFLSRLTGCVGDDCRGTRPCRDIDDDHDGVNACDDCNDHDAAIRPGATELCDEVDNDCDGATDEDEDADGFDACADCNNADPQIHPRALETCNGRDDNCNGVIDTDLAVACPAPPNASGVCTGGVCGWSCNAGHVACSMGCCVASGWSQVDAGEYHTCAVRLATGEIRCWGDNTYGQSRPPTGTFIAVSAGRNYSCGLRTDQTVVCWGESDTHIPFGSPIGRFASVSVGWNHACGLREDGTVECWGDYSYTASRSPVGTFNAVSTGALHSCALTAAGAVVCWGSNSYGESSPLPAPFVAISSGRSHTCGIRPDASVVCWGDNSLGQSAPGSGLFTAVSAGGYHNCGARSGGATYCWGFNRYGQTSVPMGTFLAVTSGAYHTCAIRSDYSLACWGSNTYGQTGPLIE